MFVGGLSASTTIDDVKAYFESYGKVRAVTWCYCWAASHTLLNRCGFSYSCLLLASLTFLLNVIN